MTSLLVSLFNRWINWSNNQINTTNHSPPQAHTHTGINNTTGRALASSQLDSLWCPLPFTPLFPHIHAGNNNRPGLGGEASNCIIPTCFPCLPCCLQITVFDIVFSTCGKGGCLCRGCFYGLLTIMTWTQEKSGHTRAEPSKDIGTKRASRSAHLWVQFCFLFELVSLPFCLLLLTLLA